MRKLLTIPVVISCLFCGVIGVSANSNSNESIVLSEDLSKDATLIDVRSSAEFETGHLKNAINIPHTEIGEKIAKHVTQKDAKIVLYCRKGGRAEKALKVLKKLGYTKVTNAGGYGDIKKKKEEDTK